MRNARSVWGSVQWCMRNARNRGTPSQKVRVLHLLEGVLDVILRAVGQHDLLLRPVGIIGKQNGLTELHLAQAVQSGPIRVELQLQTFADLAHLGLQDLAYPLRRTRLRAFRRWRGFACGPNPGWVPCPLLPFPADAALSAFATPGVCAGPAGGPLSHVTNYELRPYRGSSWPSSPAVAPRKGGH